MQMDKNICAARPKYALYLLGSILWIMHMLPVNKEPV